MEMPIMNKKQQKIGTDQAPNRSAKGEIGEYRALRQTKGAALNGDRDHRRRNDPHEHNHHAQPDELGDHRQRGVLCYLRYLRKVALPPLRRNGASHSEPRNQDGHRVGEPHNADHREHIREQKFVRPFKNRADLKLHQHGPVRCTERKLSPRGFPHKWPFYYHWRVRDSLSVHG
jgi:hypothetical protein